MTDIEDLRRHHLSLHEQMDQAKQARERISAILGLSHIPSWQDLAAEVERRVAEDAATKERLHYQVLEATTARRMTEVRLPEPEEETSTMTVPTPGPLTAYLAGVERDLTDGSAYPRRVMELHGPRLLAAVKIVLALTGEWLAPEGDGISATALSKERARVRASCAESLNRGISAALLGEEAPPDEAWQEWRKNDV